MFSFLGVMVSLTTTEHCSCRVKAAVDNTQMNRHAVCQ